MHATSPDAVLFDLDLTLCETTQDRSEVLSGTFDRVGVDQYCGVADLAAVAPQVPEVSSDHEFFVVLFELAAERVDGVDPDGVPVDDLALAHDDLVDHSQVRFRDGAEAALEAARDHGPVALVTNGGRETQTTKLEALGIADAFDATVFCDPSAGMPPKPDPKPIRTAVDALDVDPAATLHVGDSKASDVAGAHAAGARSAWVPYEAASDDGDHDPHHTFDAPDGVRDVL
ncbi:HAD family hydrolase [Halorubellus sp. JP-L1]|uniref:HAD family hydrolase n=1 Tax=Halorubellus sp. JP-L1 TaxID=2715753 RepID=UPI00140C59F3|nr:HAD family hydrolase [Halorubellus sp. JP-L1]NHN42391.1 HAD family hydrolase [Halorubellus sp. JP-L1]